MHRALILAFALLTIALPAAAQPTVYPAVSGKAEARTLTIYSSLDAPLNAPMIAAFQAENPDVAVVYEDMLTGGIYDRIVEETDAGRPTADVAFSSAMDLQVKLANDGYAQESDLAMSAQWPRWANWRNTAYALTFEPAVFVYNRKAFAEAPPPQTRGEFIAYLRDHPEAVSGRVGTYDIERAGVGFLFLARDQDQYSDVWTLVEAMGDAGVKLYSTTSAILERVGDGRFILGYNILGSYAADWATRNPDLGIVLPKDYTTVMSRIGLVPKAASAPDLGRKYLEFMMSARGQAVLAQDMHIAAINPQVSGPNTMAAMRAEADAPLSPVPVGPGLMVYLDQVKRMRLIDRWNMALRGQ
ncbi:ABC transporter substrate-binding protein [Paradevosia shaoguanensis]|uniref:ABC transporter substrate-binding protein n=1 Tax=Paradevosia shaoguanensis TaxID=1335043 RepID=UPI001931661B|nr:ABC transporter substrate-binding protein [Paradevosia shaoguanensis]